MTLAGTVGVMPQPTWEDRELPILTALVEMFDGGGMFIQPPEIAEKTGLTEETVKLGVLALANTDPPYLDVDVRVVSGPTVYAVVNAVTGAARRVVGTWPTPEGRAAEIVALLEEVAEREIDDDRRSRVRAVAGYLGTAGKDLLVQVAATAIAKGAGLG